MLWLDPIYAAALLVQNLAYLILISTTPKLPPPTYLLPADGGVIIQLGRLAKFSGWADGAGLVAHFFLKPNCLAIFARKKFLEVLW